MKTPDWTVGGLIVTFLFAWVYGLAVLLLTAQWLDQLLRQPSWVVVVGILAAMYLPVQIVRSARQLRAAWRRRFPYPREGRAGI